MRGLLLSIRPCYARLIAQGRKKFELRRGRVSIRAGDLVFFYATTPLRRIVARARVGRVLIDEPSALLRLTGHAAGLDERGFLGYFEGRSIGSALELRDIVGWPVPLNPEACLSNGAGFVAPQSYRFLSTKELGSLARELELAVSVGSVAASYGCPVAGERAEPGAGRTLAPPRGCCSWRRRPPTDLPRSFGFPGASHVTLGQVVAEVAPAEAQGDCGVGPRGVHLPGDPSRHHGAHMAAASMPRARQWCATISHRLQRLGL